MVHMKKLLIYGRNKVVKVKAIRFDSLEDLRDLQYLLLEE